MRKLFPALLVALVLPATASARTAEGVQVSVAWPASGTITSPFGQDGGRWHPGLDIGILRSLTVRSATSGVVTRVGQVPGYAGYGNVVVVNLGAGFSAIYAHLARPLARRGEVVWPGERIGVAGCTGWCTGTHLHFELRHRGRPTNPMRLYRSKPSGS